MADNSEEDSADGATADSEADSAYGVTMKDRLNDLADDKIIETIRSVLASAFQKVVVYLCETYG